MFARYLLMFDRRVDPWCVIQYVSVPGITRHFGRLGTISNRGHLLPDQRIDQGAFARIIGAEHHDARAGSSIGTIVQQLVRLLKRRRFKIAAKRLLHLLLHLEYQIERISHCCELSS